jgi:hypothetical protein
MTLAGRPMQSLLRRGWLLLLIPLCALAAGFAAGAFSRATTTVPVSDATDASRQPLTRELARTLAVVGERGHWGSYTPLSQEDARGRDAAPGGVSPHGVRLVGIERRNGARRALLLRDPDASTAIEAANADGLISARAGDTLAAGLIVAAIDESTVRLQANGRDYTLQLYENPP